MTVARVPGDEWECGACVVWTWVSCGWNPLMGCALLRCEMAVRVAAVLMWLPLVPTGGVCVAAGGVSCRWCVEPTPAAGGSSGGERSGPC